MESIAKLYGFLLAAALTDSPEFCGIASRPPTSAPSDIRIDSSRDQAHVLFERHHAAKIARNLAHR